MGDVKGKFLKPLLAIVPPPRTDDLESFITAYVNLLDRYSDEELDGAQNRILRTIETRSIPLPKDCIEACELAREAIALRARADHTRANRKDDPAFEDWRWKNADKLFAGSKFAQQSLTEDWAWTFHTWLISNQREPDGHEANKIRADGLAGSKRFDVLVGRSNQAVENTRPSMFARKFIDWKNAANARLKQVALAG